METIINSITAKERVSLDIIKYSRKLRIVIGSSLQVQGVNRLLKQFDNIQCSAAYDEENERSGITKK